MNPTIYPPNGIGNTGPFNLGMATSRRESNIRIQTSCRFGEKRVPSGYYSQYTQHEKHLHDQTR